MRNVKRDKEKVFIGLLPIVGVVMVIGMVMYGLGMLVGERGDNEGDVQRFMNMPYEMCIIIMGLVVFILVVLLTSILYTFITEYCFDVRYKLIQKNNI
jgi:hypothetical protein